MKLAVIIILALLAGSAAGAIGGAYNSFDYWRSRCGEEITRDFIALGFMKPGQTSHIDVDQSRPTKFTTVP